MSTELFCPAGHRWQPDGIAGATACPQCGLPVVAPTIAPPGETTAEAAISKIASPRQTQFPNVPGYEILAELGRGGMGVVYKAQQTRLERLVALKMIVSGPCAGEAELARFRREALSVARLQHPNIVAIYDIGEHEGRPYFVLEYVAGGTISTRGTAVSLPYAIELVEKLARAMHYAHQQGIVHRDLKPANVLLSTDGTPKIADFGLAKWLGDSAGPTASGAVLGTPSYMAPEQAQSGKHVGPEADVYALGAILYELLTGRPPFRGQTSIETIFQVLASPPTAPRSLCPELPELLEAICLRCLEKEPQRRFASAQALAEALAALRTETEEIRPHSSPPPDDSKTVLLDAAPVRTTRLTWRAVWIAAVGLVIGVVCLGAFFFSRTRIDPSTPSSASTKGDRSWEVFSIGSGDEVFDRIDFPSRSVGYAAGRKFLYKSTDAGRNWQKTEKPTGAAVHLLRFQDDRTGWLGTDHLWNTTDGGAKWAAVDLPSVERITAVTHLHIANGWGLAGATTLGGNFVLFRKARDGWLRLDPDVGGYWGPDGRLRTWSLSGLQITGDRQAIAVAFQTEPQESGVLLATEDGGDTWMVHSRMDRAFIAVHFFNPEDGWLGGSRGALWKTQDGGAKWVPVVQDASASVSCFAFPPKSAAPGIAPLWKNKALRTNDGKAWDEIDVPAGYSMPSAVMVDANLFFVLGSEGKLARYAGPASP